MLSANLTARGSSGVQENRSNAKHSLKMLPLKLHECFGRQSSLKDVTFIYPNLGGGKYKVLA
jgi:hypothetical protein